MRWKPLRRTAMILPLSVESPSKLSEAAQGDPEPMDVYEEDLNKAKSSGIFSGKAGKSSSASASAGATPPMLKSKSKAKPEKKAMPKLKVVDEGHGPSRQEFDTSILSPGSRVDRAGQHGRGAHQEGRLRQIECHLSLHVGVPPWASTFPSSTVARDSQVGPLDGPLSGTCREFPHRGLHGCQKIPHEEVQSRSVECHTAHFAGLRCASEPSRGTETFSCSRGGMASMIRKMYT